MPKVLTFSFDNVEQLCVKSKVDEHYVRIHKNKNPQHLSH